jgi:hypothetical protein
LHHGAIAHPWRNNAWVSWKCSGVNS